MPHKRNPVKSEQVSGLARVLRGNASAAASAARHDAPVVPTVTILVTPAASAAATSSVSGGSQASRCVWLSIKAWGTATRAR